MGEHIWVDTSDRRVQEDYRRYVFDREKELDRVFKHSGVDVASISSDEDYVKSLIALF